MMPGGICYSNLQSLEESRLGFLDDRQSVYEPRDVIYNWKMASCDVFLQHYPCWMELCNAIDFQFRFNTRFTEEFFDRKGRVKTYFDPFAVAKRRRVSGHGRAIEQEISGYRLSLEMPLMTDLRFHRAMMELGDKVFDYRDNYHRISVDDSVADGRLWSYYFEEGQTIRCQCPFSTDLVDFIRLLMNGMPWLVPRALMVLTASK